MKDLIRKVGPCTLAPGAHDPFTLLVRCVISQQISTKAAKSIFDKLATAVGGPPIEPAAVNALTDEQLAVCGLSGAKRNTVRALVAHFESRPDDLAQIAEWEDELIREQLTTIKGIGPWTVDMFLIFGITRPDVLAVGDFGLKSAAMKAFKLRKMPTPDRLEKLSEPWKPFRSIATWYLWRSLDLVKKPK